MKVRLVFVRNCTVQYSEYEYAMEKQCKSHVVSDEKGLGHACYEKQSCLDCEYGTNKIGGIENV